MTFDMNLKKITRFIAITLLSAPLLFAAPAFSGEDDDHGDEGEEGHVEMTAAERKKNGVEIYTVARRSLGEEIRAPGEVGLDLYKTSQVTPRIAAQIMTRHVKLGDNVSAGEPLVTLSSVQMAEAQGNLIVTAKEWKRVERLGRKVVSDRRYTEAQVSAQQAVAKVRAFGLSGGETTRLSSKGDASKATGEFTLFARQAGTVMNDEFVLGEFIEPGRVLFAISDESNVWVEAMLPGYGNNHIDAGAKVRIVTNDNSVYSGSVLQVRHQVDETTRTISARITVDNTADTLHSGQFVTVYIEAGKTAPVMAVPRQAVTLMNGDSQVFVVDGDEMEPQKVLVGATYGEWVEIKSGLNTGDIIASTEIFLLKSLILKSKMGSGHGH
ncbi:MAG: efflux RND transporter periplasmic adaptor subunit [Robiginitomaculum sp.]|nr:efflux RND transporter periplasmic adaptor subunit [Robiginitomaculum sp.]